MAEVMTRCPETGEEVFTGIEVPDETTFRRTEYEAEDREYRCPSCGHVHHWDKEDAYLRADHQHPSSRRAG